MPRDPDTQQEQTETTCVERDVKLQRPRSRSELGHCAGRSARDLNERRLGFSIVPSRLVGLGPCYRRFGLME